MIYTVTCNPSLDYHIKLDNLQIGDLNRAKDESVVVGGKGINVSMVLKQLQCESKALGFVAGEIGNTILTLLEKQEIASDFVVLKEGNSRINVKLNAAGCETEINGLGPAVFMKDLQQFEDKLSQLQKGDTLVISGSMAKGMPTDFYANLANLAKNKGAKVIVDTTGEALKRVCVYHPFLVKPNVAELSQLFREPVTSTTDAIFLGEKLQHLGAQNVIVSMGKEGALLLCSDGTHYYAKAPKGDVIQTIGSGDSLVAGFIAGCEKGLNRKEAFLLGVAAGSASAFSAQLADRVNVEKLYKQIEAEKV